MIIKEIEKPKLRNLIGLSVKHHSDEDKISKESLLNNIRFIGSGKGAIALILGYLTDKKIIENKLNEVIVPDWLGYWVYNQIQPFAFPTKEFSDRAKVIMVYHQYGFPQNMDIILEYAREKKLIVIEDCAHVIESYYKGKKLGTFGDFSFNSFGKWLPCFILGGVESKFDDFNTYVDKALLNVPLGLTLLKDSAKFLHERSKFSRFYSFEKYARLFITMSYALYGKALKPSRLAIRLFLSNIEREVNIRQKRYSYFLKSVENLGICDHLEPDGITPYIIPLYCQENKRLRIVKKLRDRGVEANLYNFDIKRNLLSPQFVPCVCLPCHAGISDETFSDMTDIIIKENTKNNI
ncbi:MAG: DegT/DnrJ/EryC1/StrS family aminotransferase [Patescibacteria group bacterium]|nr:DegT/DnrJ/EryC1/StrS family aminotransferase [Patescibacteria group bacterium]